MQALAFPRGNIYQIVCKNGARALAIQSKDPASYRKSRIIGVEPNANDIYQLWMIEKVGFKEDEYEIVNCASNLVFDEEGGEIRLKEGKQSSDQLFKVQRIPNTSQFWLKTSAKGTQAVHLEGLLRYKTFDPNNISQIFYIAPVNNSGPLNQTCIVINNQSGKAIDVPAGQRKPGQRLIQYQINKRFNQRWRWVQSSKGYVLQSVLHDLCLDIAEEKTEKGSKVVQWNKTGGSNQQWRLIPAGNGIFKIESIHAPGMFLAIKDNNVEDGGKLQISDNDSSSIFWRFEGFVPK